MLPSEELRKEISQLYNINLEKFAWSEELKKQILSIKLDEELETNAETLEEIYTLGYNIGHCGLTSRYVAKQFNEAKLFYGKAKLLVGTKSAPNGEHAWTTINDYLIDTTLMLCIPITEIISIIIPVLIISPVSPDPTPISIRYVMILGMDSSAATSSSIIIGANIAKFLYGFR
jgi:hypothetical protein